MNLIKYKPISLMNLFDGEIDGGIGRTFDSFFENLPGMESGLPDVDVKEDENSYVMEVELPGLTEKDIEAKVDGNLLSISSKKNEEKEDKKRGYILKERKSYAFKRSFVLPDNVDSEKISASFKNGLLRLNILKAEKSKTKLLEIKSN